MRTGPITPIIVTVVLLASSTSRTIASDPAPRAIRADRQAGTSAAVIVPEGTALAFSTQVIAPADASGNPGPESVVAEALDRLDSLLQAGGSGLDRAVRLHAVLANDDLLPVLRSALANRFEGRDGPALTIVRGALPRAGASLALDAVATTDGPPDAGPTKDATPVVGTVAGAPLAVLPGGPSVFIAGQAEAADDLATATRKTLESLLETLELLGLGADHVVQLKAFYLPPESSAVVEREVAAIFNGTEPPPLVLVEWESSLPVEIELVASAPAPGSDETIDYLDTPKLPASPIYSRVARVNQGDLVFVSGLFGPEGASGTNQVERIFDDLKAILDEAGSDFDHLVKATYYVSANDSSQALNDLRPNYYDPSRPPAASKAQVPGVGLPGRSITVDMIAVSPGRPADAP